MLDYPDQIAIITAMPSAKTATVAGVGFVADFRYESEPVMFTDGSVEAGRPYCIMTGVDVTHAAISHGTALIIDPIDWGNDSFWNETWYVIGMKKRQDGMFRLTLSKTP